MTARQENTDAASIEVAVDSQQSGVGRSEVTLALEAVMHSETFARADRARALLAYLVETEQTGDASRLKGFTIAQDVFGKDDDFDPAMDAVVRVQAGRLREHLATFYTGEGRDEPIVISVPKGSYVPTYARREAIDSSPPPVDGEMVDGGQQLRHVDFGTSGGAFKLDDAADDAPLAAARRLGQAPANDAAEALAMPMIVRNIKRFWLALATILLLLTVILFLVWRP